MLSPYDAHAQAARTFFGFGTKEDCGSFVKAIEGERRATPPGADPNSLGTLQYAWYIGYVSGFFTGTNLKDPEESLAGEGVTMDGLMLWLETYCRAKPLELVVSGLQKLRLELVQRRR